MSGGRHSKPSRAGACARLAARARRDLWTRPRDNFAPLDGLRGFASLIVVFYHCALFTGCFSPEALASRRLGWLGPILNGFWSGIDIFFVLSGFLIARLLLLELRATGGLHYPSFLIRRSLRIFPAYYLMLTASLLVFTRLEFRLYYFLFGTTDRADLVSSAWTTYAYLSNYLRPGNQPSILSWSWSLCVEEHFYLLLPPLLWASHRWLAPARRGPLLAACIALPLAGRAWQYAAHPSLQLMQGFYYYSHNRFDEIFVGVGIAYLYVAHPDAVRRALARAGPLVWLAGATCIALVWSFGGLQRSTPFSIVGQFSLMALGSGLLVLNGLFLDNAATRFFAHPLWYPLARISYGTYLIHPFVLFGLLTLVAQRVMPDQIGPLLLCSLYGAVIAVSSLVAAAMFLALERPLLDTGVRLARRARQRAGRTF